MSQEDEVDPTRDDGQWEDVEGDLDFADALAAIAPEGEALLDASGGVFIMSRYACYFMRGLELIIQQHPVQDAH